MSRFRLALACFALLSGPLMPCAYAAESPVAHWEFGAEEQTPLTSVGGVHRDVPGPRPPVYPDFAENNTAVTLDGSGARFTFADPGPNSPFDFENGDEITLEAWVNVREMREGENVYVIGKGRTGRSGFARDNQNWALRVRGVNGKACVSFLFATPVKDATENHWHRWTTTDGFVPRSGWHHIAASYKFGEPKSIQTWIDGKKIPGRWDMGGPTTESPVVDDDEVWIGSSMGGSAGASFRGGLDSIAIHREILDDEILQKRFRRVGEITVEGFAPETMPKLGDLPKNRVVVTFHEGMPAHDRWLMEEETWPQAATSWEGESLLLDRLPLRYDAWGIRESWKPPVAVRMAADVELPAGKQTLLFRARGMARVWVDGKLIAKTKPLTGSPDGEEAITPVAKLPAPGHRPAGHRLQEVTGEVEIKQPGAVRVVIEAIAGGARFRAEPGELTLALRGGDGQSYNVLRPVGLAADPLPLVNDAVEVELAKVHASIDQLNDETRRTAAASRDAFWSKRHQAAKAWVKANPPAEIPQTEGNQENPIDAFLAARIEQAKSASSETPAAESQHFHTNVLPILRSECFRCHGDKDQGGLSLNSRDAAIGGGYSGLPAIEPGDPHASEMITRLRSEDADVRMPPTGKPLAAEKIQILEEWITKGARWPEIHLTAGQTEFAPIVNDAAFLRRAYLDTVGVVPTEQEARSFLEDTSADKRSRLVDQLLEDPRWADHWIGYWQDLLAENPTLINATLNATGPFRWFLYDSLRDDKPLDRMITELLLMRGSAPEGGSAGFAQAAQNDSPFAAKGHVVATAFLGIEMQCAKCHDSPYHTTMQSDLFSLAAMFARKPVSVPKSSTVPPAFFEEKERESLIQATLKPGEEVTPTWPFAEVTGAAENDELAALMENEKDTRERLATLITAPQNTRFAQVMANRVWRRLIGSGIVEPPHDWEGNPPSHPELLDHLAKELVASGYNMKHLTRLIMTSQIYQREAIGQNMAAEPPQRLFNAPDRRRLTAEQIVDSYHVAAGRKMDTEPITLDPDGRRPARSRNHYGQPHRSWMLVSLSNERDRPSLTLPKAAMVEEVLVAFGWSADRQVPKTDRETDPNVRQPAVIANSNLTVWLTRAAHQSELANLAVEAESPTALVESIFLRFLSRRPTAEEKEFALATLTKGFEQRLVPADQITTPPAWERLPQVTWSNHLRHEANTIQQEHEARVRQGPPADPRLHAEWRERYEDFVWSVVNLREFVWIP